MITAGAGELFLGHGIALAVALTTALYSINHYRRARGSMTGEQALVWLLNGALFVMLGIPLLLRVLLLQSSVVDFLEAQRLAKLLLGIPFILCALFIFAAGIFLIRRYELSHGTFLLLLLLPAFLLPRVAYLGFVDPVPFSDFNSMWRLVERVAEHHRIVTPSDVDHPRLQTILHMRRVLPIWTPLALIFGSSAWVYKISNVVLLGISILAAYHLANQYFGRRAAQLGTWIVIAVPELLMSMGIPTHDLLGTFLLLCFLVVYDFAYVELHRGRWLRTAGFGVVGGVLWMLTDLQRDWGLFILAGATLFAGAISVRRFLALAPGGPARALRFALAAFGLLLLIPFSASRVAGFVLYRTHMTQPWTPSPMLTYAMTSVDNPDGSYEAATTLLRELNAVSASQPGVPDRYWQRHYRSAILSERLYNPLDYFSQFVHRVQRLWSLGGSDGFYISKMSERSRLTPGSVPIRILRSYSRWFMGLFLIASLACLLYLLVAHRWEGREYPPLLLLSAMLFVVVLVSETQPRYAYPAWLILPIYMGAALAKSSSPGTTASRSWGHLGWGASVVSCVGILVVLGVLGGYAGSGTKLIPQHAWTLETQGVSNPSTTRLASGANALRLAMAVPSSHRGEWNRAKTRVRVSQPDRTYLLGGTISPLPDSIHAGCASAAAITVTINGENKRRLSVSERSGPTHLIVRNLKADADGFIHIVLQAGALTNHDAGAREPCVIHFSRFWLVEENDVLAAPTDRGR